jgi:hypothetical protein
MIVPGVSMQDLIDRLSEYEQRAQHLLVRL